MPLDSPIAVKEAVLRSSASATPRARVVDSVLGPEMRSTGEVMGIDRNFPLAYAKSQDAAYGGLPEGGTAFISVADRDKRTIVLPALRLSHLGFRIVATAGTAEVLRRNGIDATVVQKVTQTSADGAASAGPNIVDLIDRGEIDLVINTPSGHSARVDGFEIRRATVAADKALFTTMSALAAAVASIEETRSGVTVTSLQEYQAARDAKAMVTA